LTPPRRVYGDDGAGALEGRQDRDRSARGHALSAAARSQEAAAAEPGAAAMTGFIRNRPVVSAVIAFLVLILLLSSFPIVPETKQAVGVRFGKPERILNRYQEGRPIGAAGAGLSYKVPFVDQIV